MMGYLPPSHVFREYDVRGLVGKELSPKTYELFGKAFGTLLRKRNGGRKPSCAVGRDNRASSAAYEVAFTKGLLSTGCDVVRIGQVTTPMAYFANEFLHTTGAASVTASHNPPEYNGLKMRFKMLPVSGLDLKEAVAAGKFAVAAGKFAVAAGKFAAGKKGKVSSKNIFRNYISAVSSGNRLRRKFRVVVDCGNGTAGPFVVPALAACGASVAPLFCTPDPRFPNHSPNPVQPENYPWLVKEVKKRHADLGLMLDGDGDRVAAVDAKGNIIWPDMLLLLFAREELEQRKGAKIVIEIKCSQAVADDVKARGGKPIWSRTGYTNVEKLMRSQGAPVGAEMSGHFYFLGRRQWLSDAVYASCRLAKLVSDSGKPISSLLLDAPKYYSSQEYRLRVGGARAEARKAEIVGELARAFKKTNRVIAIDGARVLFADGWGLVRYSKNEPELSLRFEGKTPAALSRIKGIFRQALSRYKEVKAGF